MQIISGYENMNIESIHLFLNTEAYWSKGISLSTVDKACKHSFCIGVFINEKQIAFSRIVTDFSTFAYLCDVYVLSEYRNQGVSKRMLAYILELDWIQNLRRFLLATIDAHSLYNQFGFKPPKQPERLLEISKPYVYGDLENPCL